MNKFKNIIFSMTSTVILLVLFAISIGYATFIENDYGTEHAKELVYNNTLFEILLVLLIINLCGSIFRYKLIDKKKWSVLLFHLAFIFMLLGAAITRYFGTEGTMHIRQGETSNEISTEKTGIRYQVSYKGQTVERMKEVKFSATSNNEFTDSIHIGNKVFTLNNELFVPNAVESIVPSTQGEPVASIFIMSGMNSMTSLTLMGNDEVQAGETTFSFANSGNGSNIQFSFENDELYFQSNKEFTKTGMAASGMIDRTNATTIPTGKSCSAEKNIVYRIGKIVFMIEGYLPQAMRTLSPISTEDMKSGMQGSDALMLSIHDGKVSKTINVLSSESTSSAPSTCSLDGAQVSVSYGRLNEKIPFSISLRAFELDRYPGSMSPSSYASEITLTDTEQKTIQPFRIYMNHILNYRGYRFFQSSYDEDEMGTILSVNKDYWGTLITYIGYLLMLIGMAWTLFNKNSRFRTLMQLSTQSQLKRKTNKLYTLLALVLLTQANIYAENSTQKESHLRSLNSLLIQDAAQGRIEPFNTYASDLFRKISKKEEYKDMKAEEVILLMSINADYWKNEPIIKIANPQLEEELNAVDGFISYNQAFDIANNNSYKLQQLVETTYQKHESQRNKYEKELINVDERINICTEIFMNNILALFPSKGDASGKWLVATAMTGSSSNLSVCPHFAAKGMDMNDLAMEEPVIAPPLSSMGVCTRDGAPTNNSMAMGENNTGALLSDYFAAVTAAYASNDWKVANTNLDKIKAYQQENGGDLLPSDNRVKLEIAYNSWNLFVNLAVGYSVIGILLLALHFFNIFKPTKRTTKLLDLAIYPLLLLFVLFTSALAIRWYISGHAPWSNGYEAMIFVGWASSLSGLLFAQKSTLAFSTTAILSAIALSVAGMSWMNPEITNLVPVLKSYWLIVHVAVITSSYGFLALGAMLGMLNLILIILRSPSNAQKVDDHIQEIAYTLEMTLIVGLFMLTVGTFLGGVWANESWGRYWGWDAKETWALVSVLVYSVILHLRLIPATNNVFVLSTAALVGFSSVIMTFVGVNYYLSGLHSYGQGTPPPVPTFVYIGVLVMVALIVSAYLKWSKIITKN